MSRERKRIGFTMNRQYSHGGYVHLEIEVREFEERDAAQEFRDALVAERSNAEYLRKVFEAVEKFKAEVRSPMDKPGLYLDGRYDRVTFRWQGDGESDHWYCPEVRFPNDADMLPLVNRIMRQVYKTHHDGEPFSDPKPEMIVRAMLDLKGTPVRFIPENAGSQSALPIRPDDFELPRPPSQEKAVGAEVA